MPPKTVYRTKTSGTRAEDGMGRSFMRADAGAGGEETRKPTPKPTPPQPRLKPKPKLKPAPKANRHAGPPADDAGATRIAIMSLLRTIAVGAVFSVRVSYCSRRGGV